MIGTYAYVAQRGVYDSGRVATLLRTGIARRHARAHHRGVQVRAVPRDAVDPGSPDRNQFKLFATFAAVEYQVNPTHYCRPMSRLHASALVAVVGVSLLVLPRSPLGAQQGRDESTFTWSKQLTSEHDADDLERRRSDHACARPAERSCRGARGEESSRSRGVDSRRRVRRPREPSRSRDLHAVRPPDVVPRSRRRSRTFACASSTPCSIPRSLRVRAMTGNGEISIERAGADVTAIDRQRTRHRRRDRGPGERLDRQRRHPGRRRERSRVSVTTGTGRVFGRHSEGRGRREHRQRRHRRAHEGAARSTATCASTPARARSASRCRPTTTAASTPRAATGH